jgi:hypothetical protein
MVPTAAQEGHPTCGRSAKHRGYRGQSRGYTRPPAHAAHTISAESGPAAWQMRERRMFSGQSADQSCHPYLGAPQ